MEFDEYEEDDEMGLPPSYDNNNKSKYQECLKNHAVGLGGHAVDGCGEFMPSGTLDGLKCAVCNFHRKEDSGIFFNPLYVHVAPLAREEYEDDVSRRRGSGRKRFTAEQKERMVEVAEKVGWRIQKHDEEVVAHFCAENGVKRRVLKVWMHNNKHTLGKKP